MGSLGRDRRFRAGRIESRRRALQGYCQVLVAIAVSGQVELKVTESFDEKDEEEVAIAVSGQVELKVTSMAEVCTMFVSRSPFQGRSN